MDRTPVCSYPDEAARKWKQERDEALRALKRLLLEPDNLAAQLDARDALNKAQSEE